MGMEQRSLSFLEERPLMETVLQVTAPHYCAGVVVDKDQYVIEAAPILGWTVGWHVRRLMNYFKRKNYQVVIVPLE
jgi:hypothetical protein